MSVEIGQVTDPRIRRSFAHAAIARAKFNWSQESVDNAVAAVENAGNSRKSLESGFGNAIDNLKHGHPPYSLWKNDPEQIYRPGAEFFSFPKVLIGEVELPELPAKIPLIRKGSEFALETHPGDANEIDPEFFAESVRDAFLSEPVQGYLELLENNQQQEVRPMDLLPDPKVWGHFDIVQESNDKRFGITIGYKIPDSELFMVFRDVVYTRGTDFRRLETLVSLERVDRSSEKPMHIPVIDLARINYNATYSRQVL